MSEQQYTCAYCGGTFNKGWSDEEAMAEQEEAFPDVNLSDCAMVCDACYKRIMHWKEDH
jgi:hypothetical protein